MIFLLIEVLFIFLVLFCAIIARRGKLAAVTKYIFPIENNRQNLWRLQIPALASNTTEQQWANPLSFVIIAITLTTATRNYPIEVGSQLMEYREEDFNRSRLRWLLAVRYIFIKTEVC